MLRQAKFLQNTLPFKRKFKTSTDRSNSDASFQEKMEGFGKQIQEIVSCQNSLPSNNNWQFYLSDIEKIVFEPVSELLK